jgi:diacylglycerol diphosphate phosphatase/phosphatidate phosphatase
MLMPVASKNSCRESEIASRHVQHMETFYLYLCLVWADIIFIAFVAALTLSFYLTPVYLSNHRSMPVWCKMTGNATHPVINLYPPKEYQYPSEVLVLPSWACGIVVILLPSLVVALFQLQKRCLWDLHAGIVGILKASVMTYVQTRLLRIAT